MPFLSSSTYQPPYGITNCHLQTILPSMFRKVKVKPYERERINTPDDDFIDLDWLTQNKANKVVIVCHGLEGDAHRPYVKGMARIFYQNGWTACGYNYRGCSGENNKQIRGYHSGATDDLQLVINHVLEKGFTEIVLVGFSLGGNLVLKYVGEQSSNIHPAIKKVVAFAAPCELAKSGAFIHKPSNWIYLRRFMRKLRKKVRFKKAQLIEAGVDYDTLSKAKTFPAFDDIFTGPVHGFKDAMDYYTKCSAKQFLPHIKIPTLLVSAEDDPFLSPECFPIEEAKQSDFFHFEMPKHGGHMGFLTFGQNGHFWSDLRALKFVQDEQ